MAFGVSAVLLTGPAFAHNDHNSDQIPHLDHVFLIMLAKHAYGQIIGNRDAPIINQMAQPWKPASNCLVLIMPAMPMSV